MGFLSSTVGFARYRVDITPPDNFWPWAMDKIRPHLFHEDELNLQPETRGWTAIKNPFNDEITSKDISYSNYLILTLRVDYRKLPLALLKKHLQIEEMKICRRQGIKKLAGKIRQELKERISQELLKKVMPVPKTYDLMWNISSGTLLFFSCQQKALAHCEDLFYQTFSSRLIPLGPYTLAQELLARETEAKHNLEQLRPAILTSPKHSP